MLALHANKAFAAPHAKIFVEKDGWKFEMFILPVDIKGKRSVTIAGTRPDGTEVLAGATLPNTDSIVAAQAFEVDANFSYRYCRSAFLKDGKLTFDGTILRLTASFTGDDLRRCSSNAEPTSFDIVFNLGPTQRSQLNLPSDPNAASACSATIASQVPAEELAGAKGSIGIAREPALHDPNYWGRRWRDLLGTEYTQTGPERFAPGSATAWAFGEEIEVLKVALRPEPYSRGFLQIKRIRDGKVGFVNASDIVVGRPETCSPEALLQKGIRVVAEIAKGATLVGDDGNWIKDPKLTHALCDTFEMKGFSCRSTGHPDGITTNRFILERADAKQIFAVPNRL